MESGSNLVNKVKNTRTRNPVDKLEKPPRQRGKDMELGKKPGNLSKVI